MSARSKLIVQRALQFKKNDENLAFSTTINPLTNEHSLEIPNVLAAPAEVLTVHVTAESEIFSAPCFPFENKNEVQSWIDSQPHTHNKAKTMQTLENVGKDAFSGVGNQIYTDTQVPSYSTDDFEIVKDTFVLNNSTDDDDSVRDRDFSPTSSIGSSSDEECSSDNETQNKDDIDNKINKICTKIIEREDKPKKHEADEQDKQEETNEIQEQEEAEVHRQDDNITPEPKTNSRKRLRRPETWKRNLKKKKVNSGKSYLTEGNRQVQEKKIKASCKDNCRFKCFTIERAMREAIFNNFWGLGENSLQRQFAASHMELVKPKYRRVTEGSTRGENIGYFFTINGERRKVCKLFFMNTLNVGDRFVRTTWAKAKECNIVRKDERGNHKRHKTLGDNIKNSVRDHINSFQAIESHYLRANTTRKFIDGSLTLAQMYRYYKQEQQARDLPFAKRCTYETIFNREFNISFHQPKKDQCSICETYKNSNPEEKAKIQEKYDRHIENKIKSREEKAKDTAVAKNATNNIIVACFDLQALLPTPCGDVSAFYYKCRLNCFNFTIFEIATKRGLCYFWHEAIASRGANEIATCLFRYISSLPSKSDLIFYSDNCVGQNKNKIVVSMYLYAVCNTEVNSIVHKFLTVGHTQNEGDSMHSVIERQKKRALKSGPIFVPSQWTPLIKTAIKQGKPYEVKELATEEFFNFKEIANQFGPKFTKNSKNEKVVWIEIQALKVEKENPNKLFYKLNFEDEYKEIDLSSRRTQSLKNSALTNAYDKPPTLKEKNKEHLLELCKKNLIEKVHQPFYFNICS